MSETIRVYRPQPATDEDGNPIRGSLGLWKEQVGDETLTGAYSLWKQVQALIAPETSETTITESANTTRSTHTLYIRSTEPTGIRNSDVLEVRGKRTRITGHPQAWTGHNGQHLGEVIHIRLTEG
ncbi:hypothetical protein [Bifidobacterium sp.]|uniref:hypothetical protein n=1 Tax=Bifidobacterium sp. TaxID=41200 RepID=UPI0039EBE190